MEDFNLKSQVAKEVRNLEMQRVILQTLIMTGNSSGEVTFAKAQREYGSWFVEAVRAGVIRPSRIGRGDKPTRWYLITDILAAKEEELRGIQI